MRQVMVDVHISVIAQLASALPMFGINIVGSRESQIDGCARLILDGSWLLESEQPEMSTLSFTQHATENGMRLTVSVARTS